MEYSNDFLRDFRDRTMKLIDEYHGHFESTLLVNCLLGLLVLPKEKNLLHLLPNLPFDQLSEWGIHASNVKNPGKCSHGHNHPLTLHSLIRNLRNSIAHFDIQPIHISSRIAGYAFKDKISRFHVELSTEDIRALTKKLSLSTQPSSAEKEVQFKES